MLNLSPNFLRQTSALIHENALQQGHMSQYCLDLLNYISSIQNICLSFLPFGVIFNDIPSWTENFLCIYFLKCRPFQLFFPNIFFVYDLMERLLSPVALLLFYLFFFLFLYFIFVEIWFKSNADKSNEINYRKEKKRSQRYLNETLLLYFPF